MLLWVMNLGFAASGLDVPPLVKTMVGDGAAAMAATDPGSNWIVDDGAVVLSAEGC